jgi:hypothetical protein
MLLHLHRLIPSAPQMHPGCYFNEALPAISLVLHPCVFGKSKFYRSSRFSFASSILGLNKVGRLHSLSLAKVLQHLIQIFRFTIVPLQSFSFTLSVTLLPSSFRLSESFLVVAKVFIRSTIFQDGFAVLFQSSRSAFHERLSSLSRHAPNNACSGRRGVCAIYRHFSRFKLFLLSNFYLPPPLVRR